MSILGEYPLKAIPTSDQIMALSTVSKAIMVRNLIHLITLSSSDDISIPSYSAAGIPPVYLLCHLAPPMSSKPIELRSGC